MIEILNADNDGNARSVMAHYHKDGCRNLLTAIWGGQMDGHIATGVIEYEYEITEDLGESDTESRE